MIKLYVVKDKASNTTNDPFHCLTDRDAVEGFKQVVNDEKTTICRHPEDFDLYYLGDYDPRSMDFSLIDTPKFLISASELKQ